MRNITKKRTRSCRLQGPSFWGGSLNGTTAQYSRLAIESLENRVLLAGDTSIAPINVLVFTDDVGKHFISFDASEAMARIASEPNLPRDVDFVKNANFTINGVKGSFTVGQFEEEVLGEGFFKVSSVGGIKFDGRELGIEDEPRFEVDEDELPPLLELGTFFIEIPVANAPNASSLEIEITDSNGCVVGRSGATQINSANAVVAPDGNVTVFGAVSQSANSQQITVLNSQGQEIARAAVEPNQTVFRIPVTGVKLDDVLSVVANNDDTTKKQISVVRQEKAQNAAVKIEDSKVKVSLERDAVNSIAEEKKTVQVSVNQQERASFTVETNVDGSLKFAQIVVDGETQPDQPVDQDNPEITFDQQLVDEELATNKVAEVKVSDGSGEINGRGSSTNDNGVTQGISVPETILKENSIETSTTVPVKVTSSNDNPIQATVTVTGGSVTFADGTQLDAGDTTTKSFSTDSDITFTHDGGRRGQVAFVIDNPADAENPLSFTTEIFFPQGRQPCQGHEFFPDNTIFSGVIDINLVDSELNVSASLTALDVIAVGDAATTVYQFDVSLVTSLRKVLVRRRFASTERSRERVKSFY